MSAIQAALTVVTVLVVPYLVQAIKTKGHERQRRPMGRNRGFRPVRRADRDGERHPDRPQRMG